MSTSTSQAGSLRVHPAQPLIPSWFSWDLASLINYPFPLLCPGSLPTASIIVSCPHKDLLDQGLHLPPAHLSSPSFKILSGRCLNAKIWPLLEILEWFDWGAEGQVSNF